MHPRGQRNSTGEKTQVLWGIAVWALILAYIAFFAALTVLKHDAFQTTAFDLGNVDQAVWNTRHGRPFAMTNIEGLTNRLGTHVEPILLPISLLYFLWSDPRLLLLLQTVIIALGAWPVYLLSKHANEQMAKGQKGKGAIGSASYVLAFTFALVYLLIPALQSANTFDFHAVALAPTFFLLAFYFLETERWGAFALFAVLTMSCKEDMPLLVVMMGLYALVVRRNWRVGLATIVVAAVWFVLAVGVIMPHFDPGGVAPLANRYAYLGDSPLEIVLTMITQPGLVVSHLLTTENLGYLRDLLAPVAFLSLLAPQVLVLATPILLANLLSTNGLMRQLEGFHYGATLVPIVVVSAAYGAAWLIRHLPRFRYLPLLLAVAVLATTLVYHRDHGYTPLAADPSTKLGTSFQGSWPTVTEHHHLGRDLARGIPTEASLAALPHPNPHASQRQQLSMIDRVEDGFPAPLHDAEYVWLDVTNGWPLHPNDLRTGVENLLAGDYGVEQGVDGWLLLRRGAPEKALPSSFYDMARASDPQPQYPMQLQFLLDGEPILESLGFDLVQQPPTSNVQSPISDPSTTLRTSLRFFWRALKPLPPGLRLYPFYLDDTTGQILEDTTQRPMIATVWYPPRDWQPGEVVVTSTLPWGVGPDFSVGLGVMQGNDWEDVGQRLPIRVQSSELVVRLFDGDTWARLLGVENGEPIEEQRVFTAPSPQHLLDVDFGGLIRLLGYDLSCEARAGTCELQLFWQAARPTETSYTVFAQLLGPAGRVHTQVDSVPQSGGYPTTWWLPGEVVRDTLTLELPESQQAASRDVLYHLIVGLYDPSTGSRLPVAESGADFVELATVEP